MEWSDWIQDVGKTVITSATEAQYKQPFEIQKMQLAAMGPFGTSYFEGRPNTAASAPVPATVAGIPSGWLLIAGIAALVMMAAD